MSAVQLRTERLWLRPFEAPDVGTETVVLSFGLRADDGALLSPAARVDVTVVPVSSSVS